MFTFTKSAVPRFFRTLYRCILILSVTCQFAPSFASNGYSENSSSNTCAENFQRWADTNNEAGWISIAALRQFASANGSDVVRESATTKCTRCGRPQACMTGDNLIANCCGCGKGFDATVEVRDATLDGVPVTRMEGVIWTVDGQDVTLESPAPAPRRCAFCSELLDEGHINCESCGAKGIERSRRSVEFKDPAYQVVIDPSEIWGFRLIEPEKKEKSSRRQKQNRRQSKSDDTAFASSRKPPPLFEDENHTEDSSTDDSRSQSYRYDDNSPTETPARFSFSVKRSWLAASLASLSLLGGYLYWTAGPTIEVPTSVDSVVLETFHKHDDVLGKERYFIRFEGVSTPQEISAYEYQQWAKSDEVELLVNETGAVLGVKRVGP